MKRQNLWNEDAWSELSTNRKDVDASSLAQQLKKTSPDHSKASIHDHQLRAEFSDFNVDGLRRFQNSKKYINPNPYGTPKRDFDFSPNPNDNKNSMMNDFLNWDMNTASNNTNPSQSTPTQDFTEFNFGTANRPDYSAPFDNDIFNQNSSKKQATTSEESFWDTFGQNLQNKPSQSLHTQSDMTAHSINQTHKNPDPFDSFGICKTGDPQIKSTAHQLLELSLEPKEGHVEKEDNTGDNNSKDDKNLHSGDNFHHQHAHQAIQPQDKPQIASPGGNSFLELNLG